MKLTACVSQGSLRVCFLDGVSFAPEEVAQGYSIDSRTVGSGQLFFAVKGERLDGHDFVEQALEKGAAAAVVRKDQLGRYPAETRLLAVEDTLVALQTLATAVRKLWGKPLIAVTGSAGRRPRRKRSRTC
jgi:UDP-N-acetylmuramoyl-tripeptide--D-alanyl-D-alanine ligase